MYRNIFLSKTDNFFEIFFRCDSHILSTPSPPHAGRHGVPQCVGLFSSLDPRKIVLVKCITPIDTDNSRNLYFTFIPLAADKIGSSYYSIPSSIYFSEVKETIQYNRIGIKGHVDLSPVKAETGDN